MFKGGMASMMQKAQKMQVAVQNAQAEIQNLTATGESAGGLVTVNINGKYQVTEIKIDTSVMNDKDLLKDLIVNAMNNATGKISELSSAKMKNATSGIDLPI